MEVDICTQKTQVSYNCSLSNYSLYFMHILQYLAIHSMFNELISSSVWSTTVVWYARKQETHSIPPRSSEVLKYTLHMHFADWSPQEVEISLEINSPVQSMAFLSRLEMNAHNLVFFRLPLSNHSHESVRSPKPIFEGGQAERRQNWSCPFAEAARELSTVKTKDG